MRAADTFRSAMNRRMEQQPPPQSTAIAPSPVAPQPLPPPQKPAAIALPTLQKTAVEPIKVDRSCINSQSAMARRRAQEGESALLQQNQDAIARKLAAQGGGPGGVDLKLTQMATDESGKRLADVNEGIMTQEQAAMAQAGQLEQQINLQAQEAQAARDLQKYQADTGAALQKYGADQSNYQFESGRLDAKAAQDELMKQQAFENTANTKTNVLNTIISMKNSGIAPEQIGAVLKGLNIEGLGIDMSQFVGVPGLTQAPAVVPKPAAIPSASQVVPTKRRGRV